MTPLTVVIISSYTPRHDGLATFATDLQRALSAQFGVRVQVIAIDPEGETAQYDRRVIGRIQQNNCASYERASDIVRRAHPDFVCVQHEFGLWGEWNEGLKRDFALPFLDAMTAIPDVPIISTLHTIRPAPPPLEREVLRGIVEQSDATVVMARMGAMILIDDYDLPPDRIVRIPHGVPVVERRPRQTFKRRLGLEGRTIISTVGLLDPRKGVEYAIGAMPAVVHQHPDALYLVVGETHPETRKREGEQYRNDLRSLVRELGVGDSVRFVNHYLNDQELVDYLQASDIYVTPYLDRNQITSGALAFAVGTGRAIVSTPYLHATEALAEGRGLLAEFRSAESLAQCLLLMLNDPEGRREMERRTAVYGKQDAWPAVGARYVDLFQRFLGREPLGDLQAVAPDPLMA